jgi:hypothetical protein
MSFSRNFSDAVLVRLRKVSNEIILFLFVKIRDEMDPNKLFCNLILEKSI